MGSQDGRIYFVNNDGDRFCPRLCGVATKKRKSTDHCAHICFAKISPRNRGLTGRQRLVEEEDSGCSRSTLIDAGFLDIQHHLGCVLFFLPCTLPLIIMEVDQKMGVSPILVSFHLGWFSTSRIMGERVNNRINLTKILTPGEIYLSDFWTIHRFGQ